MIAPTRNTSRLTLRRFQPTDRQFVLELHQGPDLRTFIESAVLETLDDADEWIARSVDERNPWHGFWCASLHDVAWFTDGTVAASLPMGRPGQLVVQA